MKYLKYLLVVFISFFVFSNKYSAHIELQYLNEKDNYKPGETVEMVASLCTSKEYIPTTGDFYIKWDANKLELNSDFDDIEIVRNNYFIFSNAKLNFFNRNTINNVGYANIVYEYTGALKEMKSDTCFNVIKLSFTVKDSDVSTIANIYTEEDYYSALNCYDTKYEEHVKECYKVYDTALPVSIVGNDIEGSLTSLVVKDAILGNVLTPFPAYSSDIKNYTYEVDNNVTSIRISSQCLTEGCVVSGNGKKSLVVGENNYKIVTKVNNKKTTYKITVIRKGSKDATLKSIKLLDSDNKKIEFNFDGKTSNYITVPNSVNKITFDTECHGRNCTVKEIDNKELKIGVNKIKLMVIAEDKENTNTYTFYVTRLKEDLALLNSLSIKGFELNETFNPNLFEYTVNTKRNTKELEFIYEKSNEKYIVIIDGNTNLGKDSKEITLTVKGTDSNNVNIYKITTIPQTRGYVIFLYVTVPLLIIAFCLLMFLYVLRNKKVQE